MAIIKDVVTCITTNAGDDVGEKEGFVQSQESCKLVWSLWKSVWSVLKNEK